MGAMPVGLRLAAVCCTACADTAACAPPRGGANCGAKGGGCWGGAGGAEPAPAPPNCGQTGHL